MHRGFLVTITTALVLAGCQGGGGTATGPGQGVFALQAQGAARGGEARVTMRSLPSAGAVVTLVGQLSFDADRLAVTGCELAPKVTDVVAAKALHWAQPQPGTVRAVVVGGLDALPAETDVVTCTFTVKADAPRGTTTVRADGDVSDTTLQERVYTAQTTLEVQ